VGCWHDFSDVKLADALDDRASFRRFCGFARTEPTPERTAINPSQVDSTLTLDVANDLRHSQFRRGRDHHVHVVAHQMTLDNLATFLRRELTKDVAQMPSQPGIECFASAFRDEDNAEFPRPTDS